MYIDEIWHILNGGVLIMDIFSVLSLVGGLALFLFGMEMMGDGLKRLAGGQLEDRKSVV